MSTAIFALWLVLLGCKLGANAPISWWWVNAPLMLLLFFGVVRTIAVSWHLHRLATDPRYRALHALEKRR